MAAPSSGDSANEITPEASAASDAVPEGPTSLFGVLATKCESAYIRDEAGDLQDIDMAAFLEAAVAYRAALTTLGKAVNMVLGDFDPNYDFCKKLFDADPTQKATARSFLEAERSNPDNRPGDGRQCRLKDPGGACKMQWLLRGLNFFGTMLTLMFEGDAQCANHAYEQTLKMYHGWMVSAGLKTAFMAMPGKTSVCQMQALCPELAEDKERLAEAISRDCPRAMALMVPMVHRMIAIQQELQLWESQAI